MVYTSKTLITGKTPIGSATGGGYLYDDKDKPATTFSSTQNMSIPGQNMSFTPKPAPMPLGLQQKIGTPGVGSTPITPYAPSVGFSPERAKEINKPVKDILSFKTKIDETNERVRKLRQHFRTLEQKGEFQLNNKQTEYIRKFKAKYPDYANVPDVSLYSKIILAEPKAMEQYGNIGEKTFLQNLARTPFNIAKSGAETVQRYADRYSEDVAKGGGGAFDTLAAIGGTFGGVTMDVLGNTINTVSPLMNRENNRYATTFTEGLSQDVSQAIPETVKTTVADLAIKYPTVAEYVEKGLDISNLIPFLGVLGKAKSASQVDDIMRQVKTSTSRTVAPGEILPGLKTAGKNIQKTITPDVISKDVATLRAERIRQGLELQNNNLKTVGNSFRKNTKVYKENGVSETVTPIDTFEKYGITPDIEDKTIRMGDFTANREGGLGKIQDNIELLGDEIDSTLISTGKKLRTDDYRSRTIEAAKKDPELKQSGKVQTTINKINDRFDDYKQSYGDEIDIFEVNNIRKTANKDWNPDTTDVSSIVGDVGRDIVYNATDDMKVKSLLREQGNLLAARKYAQSLNGTKIRGGRLGDYIAGGSGAVVGALAGTMIPIPIVGPAIGAGVGQQVGSKLSKLFGATQFKSPMAEFKGLFKSEGGVSPKGKAKPQIKASIESRLSKGATSQKSSSNLPSPTKSASNEQKLLPPPQSPQLKSGKSSVLSRLSKEKSKSAGKKVNTIIDGLKKKKETAKNSIVEKLKKKEVKANLPPKVEGKTAQEISSEEKSIMESAPQPIKGMEVPADYMPKDGLPTGTEFESAVLPKTKTNKIPSPDIKRPQIRGIDLGIRSDMIDSLKKEGVFTDSFFAITDKNLSKKFIDYAEQKALKKGVSTGGKEVSMSRLLDTAKKSADTTLTPQEYVKGLDGDKAIYLRFDLGDGNKVAVNSSYTDIFFKNFDDVTFKGSNELSPVVVYSKGKDVGVIMPIKDPYGSKEVLGDFTTATKPKSSLPMSQKSEVVYSEFNPPTKAKISNIFKKNGFTLSEARKGRRGTEYTGGVKIDVIKKDVKYGKDWVEEPTGKVKITSQKKYHVTGSQEVHGLDSIKEFLNKQGIEYVDNGEFLTVDLLKMQ